MRKNMATHTVLPSATDPEINIFNDVHCVYVPPSANGNMLIFFSGSGAVPSASQKFMETGQEQGFHVIGTTYPSSAYNGSPCTSIQPPTEQYLDLYFQELFTGESLSPLTSINQTNSISNRLNKLLSYLLTNYPSEGWDQFYSDAIDWTKVITSGHSQGGGHAAFIGKYHPVQRVICMSAPRELCKQYMTVWGTLPIDIYRFFTHEQDHFSTQQEMITSMGFNDPYINAYNNNGLTDQATWGKFLTASQSVATTNFAHKCTTNDTQTPKDANGIPLFKPMWIHLLTN